MNQINWKEVWEIFDDCMSIEKKESTIEEKRKLIEWIVEKQLRSRYARIS